MEYGNFDPIRFEQSDETSDESKRKSKKKKRSASSSGVSNPETGKTVKKEALAKQAESLWGRLIGEKPKVEPENEVKDLPSEVSTPEEATPAVAPEARDVDAVDVEQLDADEERYALEAYLDSREATLQDGIGEDEPPENALARQANLDFLTAIRQNLERNEEGIDPVNEAFEQVTRNIDSEASEIDNPRQAPVRHAREGVASGLSRQRSESADSYHTIELSLAQNHDSLVSPAEEMPETVYVRQNTAGSFLVGGVIGYVLGRRRGRIKTEKRLAVVQKKLEKQIDTIQRQVIDREGQIQQLVREKVSAKRALSETRLPQTTVLAPEKRTAKAATPGRPERPVEAAPARPETVRPTPAPRPERAPRHVELSGKDVLALSEKITIGATNLRQVYETKLIGESGLRRLVYEHLEGRDIRRALAREFLVKELSFERDPRLRDSLLGTESIPASRASTPSAAEAAQTSSLDDVLPTRSTDDTDHVQPPAGPRDPAPKSTVSTGLLTALALLALGLAVYAILLSMNR